MYSREEVAEWIATFVLKEKPPFLKRALQRRRKPRKFTVHLGSADTVKPVVVLHNPLESVNELIGMAAAAFHIGRAKRDKAQIVDFNGIPITENNIDQFDTVVLKLHSSV
jgi:hypothetical protein